MKEVNEELLLTEVAKKLAFMDNLPFDDLKKAATSFNEGSSQSSYLWRARAVLALATPILIAQGYQKALREHEWDDNYYTGEKAGLAKRGREVVEWIASNLPVLSDEEIMDIRDLKYDSSMDAEELFMVALKGVAQAQRDADIRRLSDGC